MKIFALVTLAGAATAAVLGAAAPAAFAASGDSPRTVVSVHTHTDARAQHITAAMTTLRTRVTANKRLAAPARATVLADIDKALADTAAWRKAVDSATTMTQIQATIAAQRTVIADLAKVHTDRLAAHAAKH